jgi:hypothetical protein
MYPAKQTSVFCATGDMCTIPTGNQGIKLTPNQFVVTNRLEATTPNDPILIYNGLNLTHDPKRAGSGTLKLDKDLHVNGKIMVGDRDLMKELDRRGAGLSSSGGKARPTDIRMKGPTLTNNRGRLNINAKGPLYVLAQDGLVVSKDWRGNGKLTVEGELCVGDVCFNAQEWRQIKKLLAAPPGQAL